MSKRVSNKKGAHQGARCGASQRRAYANRQRRTAKATARRAADLAKAEAHQARQPRRPRAKAPGMVRRAFNAVFGKRGN